MAATAEQTLTVACVQMRSGANIQRNIADMEIMVRDAAAKGAQYIQTPEMTGILQRNPKELFQCIVADEHDPVFEKAAQLAKELSIWLHIGSTAVNLGDGMAANRAGLFDPMGERVAVYDKIHMFDVDLDNGESWRESRVYRPGSQCVLSKIGEVSIGLSICYDLRFPHLYRHQAKSGAEILTCPAAFTKQTGEAHWHKLLQARAIENGAYVIAAAQGGLHEDGRTTYGHSVVINPWGGIIAEAEGDEPGIILAEIDLGEVEKARQKVPSLANERRFSIATMTADNRKPKGEVA